MTGSLSPRQLRIGYLMQNGAPDLSQISGPQLHTLAVINGLIKLGHTVRAVGFQKDRLGWSDDLQEWSPPRYGFTKRRWFRYVESLLRRIQYELKIPFLGLFDSLHYADACHHHLDGFDVLYERHGYMGFGGLIAARWLGVPVVLELNGNIIREIDERGLSIPPLQRRIGMWITIQTLKSADRVVVVSEALRQTLIHEYGIPTGKVSVVLNGVNIELFSQPHDHDAIRSRHGLPSDPIVTFVGSFEPWHGVDLLVSSFEQVRQRHPDSQLVIVGDGSGKDKAVSRANDLGLGDRVRFLGRLPQDQVAAVLSISRVLVAPYPFESGDIVGTPLKIMEYMAAGKGIVASTAPIHERIEDGVTGLRVAQANEKALADGIVKLLENDELCASLGGNAFRQAQTYSWDHVSAELANIFMEVLGHASETAQAQPGSVRLENS